MRVDLLPEDTNASGQIASFRLDIDPTSSPDPMTGGLLVVPGQYNPTNEFNIPLTDQFIGAGLCTTYVIGSGTEFDLSNISNGVIKFLRGGHFHFSFDVYIIDSVDESNGTICMILRNGDAIFASPPAAAGTRTQGDSYATIPGLLVKSLTGSANVLLEPGDEIVLRLLLNNTTPGNDAIIQHCTNLSCTKIDYNIYGIAGIQGIPGADGVIQSVDNVNNAPPLGTTSLVQNPGANPNILIKNLKEGSNITITDNGTDLEIAASGAALPNSDLENIGAGNTILVDTGVLPVTSTRNFKSLLAGTNITLTPGVNDITISSSSPTPNSDFANVGAGSGLLTAASTGVLPVTTTRSIKSLIAGSNITLTPGANDITIGTTLVDTNIYNSDGSITGASNRVVDLAGHNITWQGVGQMLIRTINGCNIQDSLGTSSVLIGRSGNTTTINSGNIEFGNIPVLNLNTVLTYNTGTKRIGYTTANISNSIFSVGTPAFNQAGPFAASYQLPTAFAVAYSTSNPTNHPGFNNAGVTLDLGTGVYTPSQTNNYEVLLRVTCRNDTEVCNFNIQLYNTTDALVLSSVTCNSGVINQYSTFTFNDRLTLSAAKLYVIRLILNNGAATTYNFSETIFSVNLI